MKAYIGKSIDKTKLLSVLRSLLHNKEALEGAVLVNVNLETRVTVITSQRVIYLTLEDYEVNDSIFLLSIKSNKRYSEGNIWKLRIRTADTSILCSSTNAVDIMWMDRILDEHLTSTSDEKVEGAVRIETRTHDHTDSKADRKLCDICKAETPADANYCGKCGARLPQRASENETLDLQEWSNCPKCGRQVDKQLKTCPYCEKKRTSGPNKAAPVVATVIVALLVWGMLELDDWNEEFKTVDQALAYFKNPELFDEVPDVFGFHFENDLLHNYSYYGIDDWSLEVKERKEELVHIQVYGTTINAYGAELERNPVFVLKNDSVLGYEIVDSYRFFVFDSELDESIRISDMVKHAMSER